MARHQLLAAATCRRALIAMPRPYAAIQLRSAHRDQNPAKPGSPTAFLFKGRQTAKPSMRRVKIAQHSNDPIPEFAQLAEKAKSNTKLLPTVVKQYSGLVEKGLADQRVTILLAEVLQNGFRNGPASDGDPNSSKGTILGLADQLVADIRAGKAWPSVVASLRLISLCKETLHFDKGKEYWNILSEVEGALDAGVYGSYIELLAEEGSASLAEMEELYQEALGRFPGTFAAYHLSHNAILPDRKRTTNFVGMSAHLLQGIVTARLVKGDWKNAYLGLDTAFRLWPTQIPARFLHLVRTHRPVAESYRVFMMATRAGAQAVRARDAVIQTNELRDLLREAPLEQRPEILMRTVDIMLAFVGFGGPCVHHFLTSLMKNLEALVPHSHARTPEGQDVADLIAQTARELYDELENSGIKPRLVSLASRIHLAGKTMCVREIGLAMRQMKTVRAQDYGESGSLERNVLLAAGKIKHKDLIVEAWSDLKAAVHTLRYEDYYALAVACRDADFKAFFLEEYTGAHTTLSEVAKEAITFQLNWEFDTRLKDNYKSLPLETVKKTMEELKEKFSGITTMIRKKKALNFHEYPVPADMDGIRVGSEDAMRVVYDELTTDPLAPPPPQEDPKHQQLLTSATGIPLGELRFLNWVMVTELLKLAEKNEQYNKGLTKSKAEAWIRPPPEAVDPPISDPAELLTAVKRLRNIEEVPKPPEVFPDLAARKEEVRLRHQAKM